MLKIFFLVVNNPYKQGPTAPTHSYKYYVPLYSLNISNTYAHLIEYSFIHTLSYSPKSYTYLSAKVFCFVGFPSWPPNKGHSQFNPCPARRVPTPNFGKYIWRPPWGRGKTYPAVSCYLSLSHPWLALKRETPFEGSNPPTVAMPDTDTL
ncbi:hypothetical protein HKD37_18G050708 [Glycine soja]